MHLYMTDYKVSNPLYSCYILFSIYHAVMVIYERFVIWALYLSKYTISLKCHGTLYMLYNGEPFWILSINEQSSVDSLFCFAKGMRNYTISLWTELWVFTRQTLTWGVGQDTNRRPNRQMDRELQLKSWNYEQSSMSITRYRINPVIFQVIFILLCP